MSVKPILSAAIKLLEVIPEIVKRYLTEKSKNPLYNKDELKDLIAHLKQLNPKELKHSSVKQTYENYLQPLPLRPAVSELVNARTKYILELKKHTDLIGTELIEVAEQLFFAALIDALQAQKIPDFNQLTADFLDDFFEEFSANFRVFFIKSLKKILAQSTYSAEKSSSSPRECKQSADCPSHDNTLETFIEVLGRTDTFDSDLGEVVEETIVEDTPTFRYKKPFPPRVSETPHMWAKQELPNSNDRLPTAPTFN